MKVRNIINAMRHEFQRTGAYGTNLSDYSTYSCEKSVIDDFSLLWQRS